MDADEQNAIEWAHEVATEARKVYGAAAQDRMIFEECGELIAALAQSYRGRILREQVDEEIADVLLVLIGAMSPVAWNTLRAKTERLERRLK